MNRSEDRDDRSLIAEIVALLSELRAGKMTRSLPIMTENRELQPLVAEVNGLRTHLQAQTDIQRYEYILDGAGLGSWDWWLDTNAVSFDRRWCEMLGLNFDDIPQNLSTWDSRVHPDDKENAYRDIKAYLAGETPVYENIHRMMHVDGHWVWILDRGRVSERDANGKAVRFTGVHLDISELKRMEFLNQKMSADLQEAQSIAKIGSWTFDLLSNNLSWSSEHYKIFEISEPQREEDLYRLYRSRIHKDDLQQLDLVVERALKLGENFTYDHRLLSGDGSIKYVQGIGKVTKNPNGVPVRVSGTCQDVTERVTRERQSRFILDGLGIGTWKWDLTSNTLEWDDNMYRLYGAERSDFNGAYEAWETSLSPETRVKAVEEINAAVRGEKDFDTAFQVVHKSGKVQDIRSRAFVIRDENGKAIEMYGINVDRTREAELEHSLGRERAKAIQNAKLASLGEMSAGIAHEINNPLTIIYGGVRALSKFVNDPDQFARKITNIQAASERIAKIVKSLRKFSRSSNHSEYKHHSLLNIVKEALVLTEAKARRHSVRIEVDCQSKLHVFCDELEIEQVVVNMINNAIDAVKGLADRWLLLRLTDLEGRASLRITDSGTGIDREIRDKIFQPFFTTKPVGQGTGLGLSITKGILDEHRATIELVDDDLHTCFEIVFPKVEVKHDVV